MIFSFGLLSENRHVAGSRPFIASGTCKREDGDTHAKLIATVVEACEAESDTIGSPLFCIASDGESRRGTALGALTQKHLLDKQGDLFALLGGMRLMNLLVGNNDITADKDPTHYETMPKSHAEEIRCSNPWNAHYTHPSSFSSAGVWSQFHPNR